MKQILSRLIFGLCLCLSMQAQAIDLTTSSIMNAPTAVSANGSNDVGEIVTEPYKARLLCGSIATSEGELAVPSGLGCCEANVGQLLSWSAVTGAIGYEVDIVYNDPNCCEGQNLQPMYNELISTTNNGLSLPLVTDCFSWKVRAIFTGGRKSGFSSSMCSCGIVAEPSCYGPIVNGCHSFATYTTISWYLFTGALSYQIEVTWNDPLCCGSNSGLPYTTVYTTTSYSINIPTTGTTGCFSYRMRTLCENGDYSAWREPQCACLDCTPPANYTCGITGEGLMLNWDALPHAQNYMVEVSWNDPRCCNPDPNSELILTSNVYTVQSSEFLVGAVGACFSWRVKTQCIDGSFSDWGPYQCSCGIGRP